MAGRTPDLASADRPFVIALCVSMALHIAMFVSVTVMRWNAPVIETTHPPLEPLEVIYAAKSAQMELAQLQQQISQLARRSVAVPNAQAPKPGIRIPDRVLFNPDAEAAGAGSGTQGPVASAGGGPAREPVIDLTNLADAAQGNPVLMTYFGAIRERIQRTANQQIWLAGQTGEGMVYVSFVLSRNGRLQSAQSAADRSSAPAVLQDIGVKIVKASSPFPPFPPSIPDESKTILVPLEFILTP